MLPTIKLSEGTSDTCAPTTHKVRRIRNLLGYGVNRRKAFSLSRSLIFAFDLSYWSLLATICST